MAAGAAATPRSGALQLLSWGAPVWLSGLALLPLIRWLHRGGRHRRALPVSHLRLWRASTAHLAAMGARQPPDPAWRRRALLATLLFVALAEPQWPQRHPRITLWIDDSISMLTDEPLQSASTAKAPHAGRPGAADKAATSRLAAGLAQARAQLDEFTHGQVEVRALSDPWHDLGPLNDAVVATLSAGAGRSEPSPPPPALLRSDRLHWLVTDGADSGLANWPGGNRPDRTFQNASVTRNVGLERLAARRSPQQAGQLELLVKLTNGGTATETRELIVTTEAGETSRTRHQIEPGGSASAIVNLPASVRIRAALQPRDALSLDDELALDLEPLRRRSVAVDPKCPAAIATAVGTHPGLVATAPGATDAMALLDCGSASNLAGVPTVRLIAQHTPVPVTGPLKWSSALPAQSRVLLNAERLRTAARLQAGPTDAVLLAAGADPLIVARSDASTVVETSLDFGAMPAAAGPETPLLVNLMFEHLFGTTLLNGIAIAERGSGAARVAPLAAAPLARPQAAAAAPNLDDGLRPLVAAALLVLLWEVVALARQALRLRTDPGGGVA